MKQLLYNIDGEDYLLFSIPLRSGEADEANRIAEKYRCIVQGLEKVERAGFFSPNYAIWNVLCPAKNAFEFSKEIK